MKERAMNVRRKSAAMACAMVSFAALGLPETGNAAVWVYDGATGADHWGEPVPEFEACAAGAEQSPIDLTAPIKADLVPVTMDWTPAAAGTVVNNGHTTKANTANGGLITVSGTDYQLRQFHFHAPSEHAVDGKRMPTDVQFVHLSTNGTLTVLGVMMASGETNDLFPAIMGKAPLSTGEVNFEVSDVSPVMPADDGFFRHQGSMTTPPCSEIVVWTVLKSPIAVSADDIAASGTIFPINLPPLQPTGRRFVLSK
jgi:carbonic anhydrase